MSSVENKQGATATHAEKLSLQDEPESLGISGHHKSKQEKRLLFKQDVTIVPLLACSFLVAYLDRNNIGNARVMGMQVDLGLSDAQFFNCLMMFFVGYMVFQLPANLGMKYFGPPQQIGMGVVFFGMCATCTAAARNYGTVMGLRVLIGLGEACVQVGLLYFSFWYKRDEVATRAACYYASATISGCFSGLIAYGVDKNLNGVNGYHSWQWLYIVEGVPSMALGFVLFFCLPSFPEVVARKGSWWFKKEEINLALERMADVKNVADEKIVPSQILVALRDPKCYFTAIAYGALALGLSSVTSFLPTFILEFGLDKLSTQLYSMIPYAVATVTLIGVCTISDRLNTKGPILLLCMATTTVGYIILMTTTNTIALIAGTCFVAAGIYPGIILLVSWITINHCGYTKRSTAWAMAQISGQGVSIIGTQVYRNPPRFLAGHATLLAFFAVAMASTACNYFWMRRLNRQKDALARQHLEAGTINPDAEKSIEELFDYHPNFRYIL